MVANHGYNAISGFTISYGMRYPVLFPDQCTFFSQASVRKNMADYDVN